MERSLQFISTALVVALVAQHVGAHTTPDSSDILARAALSALSASALRREGATTVSVVGANRDESEFFSTSIGGGTKFGEDSQFCGELQLAYQDYDPAFVLPGLQADLVDVRWSSVALTGGLGWNHELNEKLTLRPIALASVGHVFGTALIDQILPGGDGSDVSGLFDEGLFAGGLGAAVVVDYRGAAPGGDLVLRARQSWMRLRPLEDSADYNVTATASATNLFGKYSVPSPRSGDLRGVVETSYTRFYGDQKETLRTGWLGTVGGGLELPLPEQFGGANSRAGGCCDTSSGTATRAWRWDLAARSEGPVPGGRRSWSGRAVLMARPGWRIGPVEVCRRAEASAGRRTQVFSLPPP